MPLLAPMRWRLGHEVDVAFSSAVDGDMRDPDLRGRWLSTLGIAACVVPAQVHGTRVCDADRIEPPTVPQADGLVSARRRAVGVFGADCPGLCLAAPDGLAVAHCGWRGTAAGMVATLVDAFAATSRHPRASWHALIGPGIAGDAYEVDEPVLGARAWPASALTASTSGRAFLDLSEAIACDLTAAGVARITRTGVSTHADPRLHSYRASGPKLAQLLVAWSVAGDRSAI